MSYELLRRFEVIEVFAEVSSFLPVTV